MKNLKEWTLVLEKTLGRPLDCKEVQPVHPKGNRSWVFIGRTDAKAETPILWPPHAELTHWKRSWCGRDWGQEEKGKTEDEMAGWHHRLNGHEFEWIPGAGDGQGGLACCDSWRCKESDTAEWTELEEWYKWTYLQNRNRLTESRLMVTRVKGQGRDRLGVWEWHVYTAVFKTDNQQGPTVFCRYICSVFCNNLSGKRIRKRIDTCICLTESLCCAHETNTLLLINTPIRNKN